MEKRYGLDAICYLTDVAGGAGSAVHGPAAVPVEQRVSELEAAIAKTRRELARLETQLQELRGSTARSSLLRRVFGGGVAQES